MPVPNRQLPITKAAKAPNQKLPSSLAKRDLNRLLALKLVNVYGLGNKILMAKHIFGNSADPVNQAVRFQKKLEKSGFIRVIDLGANGSAFTLTKLAINTLEVEGVKVIAKGKELGRTELCPDKKKRFVLPLNFFHNILAATALACLAEQGWRVFSEREIRQTLAVGDNVDRYDTKLKIPDGIAISPLGQVYLVEVENARKTSLDLERLINAIISPNSYFNAKFHMEKLLGYDPSYKKLDEIVGTVVVFDPKSVSGDGRKLNHHRLISEKVGEALCSSESTSKLIFCECDVHARSVVNIKMHDEKLLIGELIQVHHYHDEPEFNAPELGITKHTVCVLPNLTATVHIEGYRHFTGRTAYAYWIDGMLVCKFDKDEPDTPRGRFLTRRECYWFAVSAMHHGCEYDLNNRPGALNSHLN